MGRPSWKKRSKGLSCRLKNKPDDRERECNRKLRKKARKHPKDKGTLTETDEVWPVQNSSTLDKQLEQTRKETIKLKKLENEMKAQRKRQLLEANEKEDRVIKDLEKKLRLNRRKSKTLPKSFAMEGLDYLLEVCNYKKYKDSINLEKELNNAGDAFEDDFAVITGSENTRTKNGKYDSNKSVENTDDDEGSDDSYSGDDLAFGSEDVATGDYNNSEISGSEAESEEEELPPKKRSKVEVEKVGPMMKSKRIVKHDTASRMKELQDFVNNGAAGSAKLDSRDTYDSVEDTEDDAGNFLKQETEVNKFKEDIYGRLRDERGNIIESTEGKYVPPQLRAQLSDPSIENSEALQRLRKQMKGLLNRLTENNMHSIATQMEELYMKYSRNDVNRTFMRLLMESLVSPVLSPERIVIEHAMLISVLHANVGTEIGAHILQLFVEELDKLLKTCLAVEDKRIDNVIVLLCQLYNFKIFHACLMYDVLRKFVERFQEKDIELILVVLKNIGFNLRKDDPVSLKELILNVQKRANESSGLRENTRVRFMLDTLSAVKNNNMLKISNYDPSYVDHLKKIQKSLLRQGKYVTELKISLDDLLNADTKGRWWIVGSAWSGDFGKKNTENRKTEEAACTHTFDQRILNLAKKQRMNTDTRKNIFCILMTAEDYVDAFEKLMKLGLKGQQYQDIIYVLMHCLLKEKQYNPYYAFLAEQFCSVDRKYQLAIQFSTWDKLKEISSFNINQITNLAKFLSYLFIELKLPLSVLKVLQFTEMNKRMVRLVRQIVLAILLNDDETVVTEVFARISKSEKLFMLREGLQLFLHHFVLKNIEKNATGDGAEKLKILPKRVELAVNAMRGSESTF